MADYGKIISELDQEIARLSDARTALAGIINPNGVTPARAQHATAPAPRRRGGARKMSADARRRISESMRARWAKRRKQPKVKAKNKERPLAPPPQARARKPWSQAARKRASVRLRKMWRDKRKAEQPKAMAAAAGA